MSPITVKNPDGTVDTMNYDVAMFRQATEQLTQEQLESALLNWLLDPKRNGLPPDYQFRQMSANTYTTVLMKFYNMLGNTSKSIAVNPDLKKEVADKMLKEQRDKIAGYYTQQVLTLLESLSYMIEDTKRKIALKKFPESKNVLGVSEFSAAQVVSIDTIPLSMLKQAFSTKRYDFCSALIDRIASADRKKYGWSSVAYDEFKGWALQYYDNIAVGEMRRFKCLLESYADTARMLTTGTNSLDMSLPAAFVLKARRLTQDMTQKLENDPLID